MAKGALALEKKSAENSWAWTCGHGAASADPPCIGMHSHDAREESRTFVVRATREHEHVQAVDKAPR
jgi:hypothetical protein